MRTILDLAQGSWRGGVRRIRWGSWNWVWRESQNFQHERTGTNLGICKCTYTAPQPVHPTPIPVPPICRLNSHRLILFFSASNVLIVDLFVFYRKKIQRKMEKKSRRRQKLLPMAMRMMVMMTWILMIYKSKSMLMYIMFRFNEKISFP